MELKERGNLDSLRVSLWRWRTVLGRTLLRPVMRGVEREPVPPKSWGVRFFHGGGTLAIFLGCLFAPCAGNAQGAKGKGAILLAPRAYRSIPPAPTLQETDLPAIVDMSPRFPKPQSQGQQGSCVGWALAYLKTFQEGTERGWDFSHPNEIMSPAYIYNSAKQPGACDVGTIVINALNLLVKEGVCSTDLFPYHEEECATKPSAFQKQRAAYNRIANYWRVNMQNVASMKSQLAGGFPIVATIMTDEGFDRISDDTVYNRRVGREAGAHALLVVGYDDTRGAFRLLNSWGQDWGDQGFAWVGYDVFPDMAYEGYVAQDLVLDPGRTEATLRDNAKFIGGGKLHGPAIKGIRLGMTKGMVLSRLKREDRLKEIYLSQSDLPYIGGRRDTNRVLGARVKLNGREGAMFMAFDSDLDYLEEILIGITEVFYFPGHFKLWFLPTYAVDQEGRSIKADQLTDRIQKRFARSIADTWTKNQNTKMDLEFLYQFSRETSNGDNRGRVGAVSLFFNRLSGWVKEEFGRRGVVGLITPENFFSPKGFYNPFYPPGGSWIDSLAMAIEPGTGAGGVAGYRVSSIAGYYNEPVGRGAYGNLPDGSIFQDYYNTYSVHHKFQQAWVNFTGKRSVELPSLGLVDELKFLEIFDSCLTREAGDHVFPDGESSMRWPSPVAAKKDYGAITDGMFELAKTSYRTSNGSQYQENQPEFVYSGGVAMNKFPRDNGLWTLNGFGLRRDDVRALEGPEASVEARTVFQVGFMALWPKLSEEEKKISGRLSFFHADREVWPDSRRWFNPVLANGLYISIKANQNPSFQAKPKSTGLTIE